MSHVFKTQSLLTITVETGYGSLASASVSRILFTKPNKETGYFEGTVSGTTLVYSFIDGDIDQSGLWYFQSYIEVGGLKGLGLIATHYFEKPLL